MRLLVNNIKCKISVIKTAGALRQTSGDYRKYLLTFRSCSKSLEGFGSSSEIVGRVKSSGELCTLRKSLGDLRKSSE